MRDFERPIVIVSKCLEFEPVRWDGQIISDPFVKKLKAYVDFRPVCPEVEIGLGVPRKPVRVVEKSGLRKLVQLETDRDVTKDMLDFTGSFVSSVAEVDGFLLKSRSPSCGIKDVKIYPGTEKIGPSGRGTGFFGGAIIDRFSSLAIEDEGRLTNFDLRETFLTRIFAHAELRRVIKSAKMKEIVEFQAKNKHLLMAYKQKEMRVLGKIVANPEKRGLKEIAADYEHHFNLALAKKPRRPSTINVLLHALGYFKDCLTPKEKSLFLDLIDKYRTGSLPLIALLTLVNSWAVKYEVDYILNQTLFEPFPEGLLEMRDSGKSIGK